jgi:MFS family permease
VAITPLVGWLVDRYGRQPWLVFGNLMLALTGVLYLFVDHEGPLLYLAQMCWGVGMVMGFNAAGTMTADIAPADRMAQALGLFGAANLGMNAVSPTLGEILADTTGWQGVFVASATAGLLAAALSTDGWPARRCTQHPSEGGASAHTTRTRRAPADLRLAANARVRRDLRDDRLVYGSLHIASAVCSRCGASSSASHSSRSRYGLVVGGSSIALGYFALRS